MTDTEMLNVLESAFEWKAHQQRSFYQVLRPSVTLNPITDLTTDQFILWLNVASPLAALIEIGIFEGQS